MKEGGGHDKGAFEKKQGEVLKRSQSFMRMRDRV
jgi:hypothetical protein